MGAAVCEPKRASLLLTRRCEQTPRDGVNRHLKRPSAGLGQQITATQRLFCDDKDAPHVALGTEICVGRKGNAHYECVFYPEVKWTKNIRHPHSPSTLPAVPLASTLRAPPPSLFPYSIEPSFQTKLQNFSTLAFFVVVVETASLRIHRGGIASG